MERKVLTMKFKFIGRFMDVTESLQAYAEKKINKLDWFFGDDAEAQVKFTQERGGQNIAEITIALKYMLFRAEEASNDMYASIDSAVDKLSRQIRRHRTKLDKRLHISVPVPATEEPVEEEEKKIVRVKRFAVKPMSVEDAIMQMEMLGHNFYLFNNADTGRMSVLYIRQDGDYGLLEPEN